MPRNLLRISLVFAVPVVVLGFGGSALAAEEGMLFGITGALVVLAALFWFGDLIVIRLCKAELLTIYHDPPLFRMVEALCKQSGTPVPKIYSTADDAMNALAIGRLPSHGGIVFTDAIRNQLPTEELRNVVAHELAHIRNRDTLLGTIAATLAAALGLATQTVGQHTANENLSRSLVREAGKVAMTGALIILAPLAALVVRLLVSVKREFRADAAAAKLTGDPLAMANAIRTLEKKKHQTPMQVAPALAHLLIVSPLTKGRIARLFLTHPSMEQRIARLEAMHRQTPTSKEKSLLATK